MEDTPEPTSLGTACSGFWTERIGSDDCGKVCIRSEPTNEDSDSSNDVPTTILPGPRGRRARKPAAVKNGTACGVLHGSKRGQYSGKHDTMSAITECLNVPYDAVKEGLYLYTQTTNCRRRLLVNVFENVDWIECLLHTCIILTDLLIVVSADTCCDICNPSLFDAVRPVKPIVERRAHRAKRGHPMSFVREALYSWRRFVKRELYPLAMWGPQAILDSANCELLTSVGPIKTVGQLEKLLKTNWARWDILGTKLFDMMSQLDIPSWFKQPSSPRPNGQQPQRT